MRENQSYDGLFADYILSESNVRLYKHNHILCRITLLTIGMMVSLANCDPNFNLDIGFVQVAEALRIGS